MPIVLNATTFVPAGGAVNFEPQRQNNFLLDLHIQGLGIVDSPDVLQLGLKSFPFPTEGNEVKEIRHGNMKVHYAGAFTGVDPVALVYRDYVDRPIATAWQRWRSKVGHYGTGNIGFASQYKATGILYKLPPGNSQGVANKLSLDNSFVRKWNLVGIFPANYKETDYDQTNDGDQVEITINLSIDYILPDDVYPGGALNTQPGSF